MIRKLNTIEQAIYDKYSHLNLHISTTQLNIILDGKPYLDSKNYIFIQSNHSSATYHHWKDDETSFPHAITIRQRDVDKIVKIEIKLANFK